MDKNTVTKRVKEFANVVKKDFPVRQIILFGSYARGNAHEDSDIDVAVVLKSIDDDFLVSAARLYRLKRGIDSRIEPVLFEEGKDQSGFLADIMRTGDVIYSEDNL